MHVSVRVQTPMPRPWRTVSLRFASNPSPPHTVCSGSLPPPSGGPSLGPFQCQSVHQRLLSVFASVFPGSLPARFGGPSAAARQPHGRRRLVHRRAGGGARHRRRLPPADGAARRLQRAAQLRRSALNASAWHAAAERVVAAAVAASSASALQRAWNCGAPGCGQPQSAVRKHTAQYDNCLPPVPVGCCSEQRLRGAAFESHKRITTVRHTSDGP